MGRRHRRHHELLISTLAVQLAHEIDPGNQIGCMLAAGNTYPYSCPPCDVLEALLADRENFFFTDVQVRGCYPNYALKKRERHGVTLPIQPEDAKILRRRTA